MTQRPRVVCRPGPAWICQPPSPTHPWRASVAVTGVSRCWIVASVLTARQDDGHGQRCSGLAQGVHHELMLRDPSRWRRRPNAASSPRRYRAASSRQAPWCVRRSPILPPTLGAGRRHGRAGPTR
jgi:hypothetical protein